MLNGRARETLFILLTVLSVGFIANQTGSAPAALFSHAQAPPSSASVFITNNITDTSITSGPITFGVNVSSPSITSFLVSLQYNHAILRYNSLDATGNVLAKIGPPSVLYDCVDGISQINPYSSCTSNDAPGVVTYALYLAGSQPTPSPTNGLLFHITFNIVGVGLAQLHLLFVALANGVANQVFSQTTGNMITRDGYFANENCGSSICRPPLVSVTMSPPVFTIGNPGTFSSAVTLENPFDSVSNYTWIFGVAIAGGQDILVTTSGTVQHTYRTTGNFTVSVSVLDKYQVVWWTTITASVINNYPPDFAVSTLSDPLTLTLLDGKTSAVSVELDSINGFSGNVNLTAQVQPPLFSNSNVTASFSSNRVTVPEHGSNSTALTFTASRNSTVGLYFVTLTASHGTISHSLVLYLRVLKPYFDILCGCDPSRVIMPEGGNVSFPVFIRSFYGFIGPVTLSTIFSEGKGVNALFNPGTVTLGANQTVVMMVTLSVSFEIPTGEYVLNIIGLNQNSSFTYLSVELVVATPPLPANFSIRTVKSLNVIAGTNTTFQVQVTSLNSLSGMMGATACPPSTIPLCYDNPQVQGYPLESITPSRLNISSGESVLFQVNVSTIDSTQPGNYTIVIEVFEANGFALFHQTIVTLTVLPPALPPVLVQLHWKHMVSLSKPAHGTGTETFTVGIDNPNNSTTIYAQATITGIDQTGIARFTFTSTVFKLLPDQKILNIQLTQTLNQSDIDRSFRFNVTILWGTNQQSLNLASNQSTVPNQGVFIVNEPARILHRSDLQDPLTQSLNSS